MHITSQRLGEVAESNHWNKDYHWRL